MIFYERRGILQSNEGLVEIKNTEFVEKLKKDFNNNYHHFRSMAPIICGTVVGKDFKQGKFDRKLRMLRAPIFSLL